MSDLAQQLQELAKSYEASGPSAHHTAALLYKAAAEIDRLLERLADQIKLNEMEIHAALICKADADRLHADIDELEDALHKIPRA